MQKEKSKKDTTNLIFGFGRCKTTEQTGQWMDEQMDRIEFLLNVKNGREKCKKARR